MNEIKNFYQELKPFKNFSDFTDESHYQKLPEDWNIFITDIKNSTIAIENGKYKEVNLIGAATITACFNILDGLEFPYVFGGDGATLCMPKNVSAKVELELQKLKNMALQNFELELRVVKIPAKDIFAEGKTILVGKHELVAGRSIAFFQGGGISYADYFAKNFNDKYEVPPNNEVLEELKGLSCRWNPIPAKKGHIISLLISAREENQAQCYRQVMESLSGFIKGNLDISNPVNLDVMSYKPLLKSLKDEIRYHKSVFSFSFLKRFAELFMATLIYKFGMPGIIFDKVAYANSMRTHSDSKKFDDILRLIIDCDESEKQKILSYLEKEYLDKKIYFGHHISENALMTCFVEDLTDGNHIHFIDGGGGGYAMASKQLKLQIEKN